MSDRRLSPTDWLRLGVLAPALLIPWLSACAPVVQQIGPPIGPAELTVEAIVTRDGTSLPLQSWLPEAGGEASAIIVALHGFNDYSNAFAEPAEAWAKQGIATYAYDQRGFGGTDSRGIWPGGATLAEDLREVSRLLRRRYPETPLYVLGESMGGAVALLALAGGALSIDGLILAAPAVQRWETINPLSRGFLWLTAHTVPWWSTSGRGLTIMASDNIEMLREIARDPLVIHQTRLDSLYGLVRLMDEALPSAASVQAPTLVLYGEKDELVSTEAVATLIETLAAPGRVAIYPSGYHMLLRDLQAESVIGDIASWILNRADPLPSGLGRRLAGTASLSP